LRASSCRFNALQIVRAIAAGMVVFVHSLSTYADKINSSADVYIVGGWGELGVKIFFCISGFIIFNSANALQKGMGQSFDFIAKRFIRVAPIYWIATVAYAIKLYFQGMPPSIFDLVKSFLFIPFSNESGLMRPVLGVGWTLNYEFLFYIILAISISLINKYRFIFVSLIIGGVVSLPYIFPPCHCNFSLYNDFLLLTDYYLLYFLAGVTIAWFRTNASLYQVFVLSESYILLFILIIILFYYFLIKYTSDNFYIEPLMFICSFLCVFLCSFEMGNNSESVPIHILKLAGDASYSTYLTHGFVIGSLARAIAYFGVQISPIIYSLLMVLLCGLCGYFLYKNIEIPLLNYMNKKYKNIS
jgi:peptidoglycan/LPS O-acetylase OafA/YrhL